jgi:hypothetical protein
MFIYVFSFFLPDEKETKNRAQKMLQCALVNCKNIMQSWINLFADILHN